MPRKFIATQGKKTSWSFNINTCQKGVFYLLCYLLVQSYANALCGQSPFKYIG